MFQISALPHFLAKIIRISCFCQILNIRQVTGGKAGRDLLRRETKARVKRQSAISRRGQAGAIMHSPELGM